MHSRLVSLEEGKDPTTAMVKNMIPSRLIPLKFLQILMLFLVMCLGLIIVSMNTFRFFGQHYEVQPARVITSQLTCFVEVNSLESWVKPPSNLWHTMNDTELFWRASFVPRKREYPFDRVPKIAFMFLTKGPLPLAPLWEKFFQGNEGRFSIYIHPHPSYVGKYPDTSVFYNRQIPSQLAEWGRMSMCDAERRLLANAMLDISNEYFVLLSESCIPLRNFSVVYDYISQSPHSFMGSFDEDGPYGRGRYNPNMIPEVTLSEWRKGSQWFEVNRELAVNIIEDSKYYPKFRDFCTPACYVDEHYFPTMLTKQLPHLLANRTLTWTDWSRGGAHPATFGKSDITEMFFKKMFEDQTCLYNNQSTNLCYLFARKFAPSALDPLLELSSNVFSF
ncbi:hypothetical protein ACFE04_008626 [Oxalis oulophora]